MISEDYKQDSDNRKLASEMGKVIIKAIADKSKPMIFLENCIIIDITNDVKKISPIFKNYGYLIWIGYDKKYPNYACSTATIDGVEHITIVLPWLISKTSDEIELQIFKKHKKKSAEQYNNYINNGMSKEDAQHKIISNGKEYLRAEIIKIAKEYLSNPVRFKTFVHECIHAIDRTRRGNKKYEEEETKSEKGIKKYYNNNSETNAYYQEGTYLIDDFIEREMYNRKTFDDYSDFLRYFLSIYTGGYDVLTPENKRKLKRRLYMYWEHNLKKPSYDDFKTLDNSKD